MYYPIKNYKCYIIVCYSFTSTIVLLSGVAPPTMCWIHYAYCKNVQSELFLNSSYYAHTNPLFASLQLLKLDEACILQTALFMGKIKLHLLPISCLNLFGKPIVHGYNTRHSSYFNIPYCRTVVKSRCITVRGPLLWDTLPINISDSRSTSEFKRALFKYLISQYL